MASLWLAVAAVCFVLPGTTAVTHYERPPCQADEVQGEVLGVSGYVCSPRCADSSNDCPMDVPDLAAARPQCMLKDADAGAYCALLCTVDSQCPSSARCNRLQQAGVGICMYPLAFSDWVRQGNTRRLSYGLPQRSGSKVPQGVIQKAVLAVQNLKSKYGMQDGDADIVTVKEFLTALSGGAAAAGIAPATIPAAIANAAPAWSAPVAAASLPAAGAAALPQVQPRPDGSTLGAYQHDLDYHSARLKEGLPGLETEVTDAVWALENPYHIHALSDLLRHIVEIFLVYILIGVVYKHQALGASGLDMIPHIGFWMEYPKLMQDGITYSQQIIGGILGMDLGSSIPSSFSGGNGGGGFEPMGRGERDTFAQFEPSR